MDGGTTVAVELNAEDFAATAVQAESTAVSISFLLSSILCGRSVIMDEQCQKAYLNLINTLLNCTSDEELNRLLNTNQNLIDAKLVEMMGQVAEVLAKKGDENSTNFLIYLVCQLSETLEFSPSTPSACSLPNYESKLSFIKKILRATLDSNGNSEIVYPILETNLELLDENLAQVMRCWITAILPNLKPKAALRTAEVIAEFSNLIRKFPLGNLSVNVEIAITGNELAAKILTREAFPQQWAKLQHNLGTAYLYRIRGDKAKNLEIAIYFYLESLQIFDHQAFPTLWARLQNGLGAAYYKRIRGEKAENLEIAIQYYLVALEVHTKEDFPQDWAEVQNNLASAYVERIRGQTAENLEAAIRCYLAALEVHTYEDFPERWATLQNNLGNAYSNRLWGERAENLELAISCYLAALKVRTREFLPEEWADTQNNLGNAYSDRTRGEKAQNIEAAIQCYVAALKVRTSQDFPYDWAVTQNNLGVAYRNRIIEKQADNLEAAIRYYSATLEVFTKEDFPFDWARSQKNLGGAYRNRVDGDREENLETAIRYYLAALEVFRQEKFPYEWAETKKALGNTYLDRNQGEWKDNLELAIQCYVSALKVHTCEAFPQDYAITLANLGFAYQSDRQFQKAYDAFTSAINTVEIQRGEIISGFISQEDKQKFAERWNELYQRLVEVCVELDYSDQALEYVERSKTRNLVELLLTKDRPTIFPAEVVAQLDRFQDEIASSQYQLQNATTEDPTALTQYLQQLRQQRNELQDRYLPIGSSFEFDPFRSTLSHRTAIVEFYITTDKLLVFIVTKQTQQPIVLSSDLIDPDKLANWANSYLKAYSNKKSHWLRRLTTRLHLLAKILHIDEIIKQIPTECDKLILIPHRYLHLLPLHALPLGGDFNLFDRFPGGVSFAPSCQLLQLGQTRNRPEFTHLFAVQNPINSGQPLSYADVEVEAIQNYFNARTIFKKEIATKEAIDDTSLTAVHCAHFSCHGYFNGTEPRKSALILANAQLNSSPTQPDAENYLSLQNGSILDLNKCLTLDSIFTLNLEQCRLVTLSACETGLIDFRNSSDEYIGLPSGFLYAGASSVVSSLWTVNDLSTAFLIIRFYQNLQNGLAVALALNQAQLWLKNLTKVELETWIEENELPLKPAVRMNLRRRLYNLEDDAKPFKLPFYWAAFCAIGQCLWIKNGEKII